MEDWKQYYTDQSIVTDPGKYTVLYDDLPDDITSLCNIIQGLILHMHWAEAYGQKPSDERKTEVKIRQADKYLARITELDNAPLTQPRSMGNKIIGTCRDFVAILVSMLRYKGVPARMRVGFATYFTPGRFEDHYLCQDWNEAEKRWIIVDPQLDAFQREKLNIKFDPCDLPEGLFLPGGKAWQTCRKGEADPELFGIFDIKGMWFIGCDMIFDMMALNKIESHPWDIWPMMPGFQQDEFPEDYLTTMDYIADLTGSLLPVFAPVRLLYQTEKNLQPLSGWQP